MNALKALDDSGDIHEIINRGLIYVDLSSQGIKRAKRRAQPSPPVNLNIGQNYNSPIQQISPNAHGTQNVQYQLNEDILRQIIDVYHKHVDDLGLDEAARRRADAQVATITAQLQDEPDQTIVQKAGKSLKTVIEGAIGGAIGNAMASPGVWQTLLSAF